ncbi:MAG TPA: hypothetical protein VFH47_05285 [Candidatus Thermoplasmatota archaeon]|nr:hypothetical protein [Candidatus Thermoplasmatota archaeon]
MHGHEGHDGCGCGHAHGAQGDGMQAQQGHEHADGAGMAGGCGEGCGCGHGAGETLQVSEVAALRGFLSGIYATQLNTAQLTEYLQQMGADEQSEFGRPAQFLAARLQQLVEEGAVDGEEEAPAFALLDAVAGEDDGEEE